MKNIILLLATILVFTSCNSSKDRTVKKTETTIEKGQTQVGDTLKISSDKLEYDIIIIEPGYNTWLVSRAQPEGYYSQSFLENQNIRFVNEWNNRVLNPQRFSTNLYEMQINYRSGIDYGYDVNYKLFNYFVYFQNRYKQNLLGGRVRVN